MCAAAQGVFYSEKRNVWCPVSNQRWLDGASSIREQWAKHFRGCLQNQNSKHALCHHTKDGVFLTKLFQEGTSGTDVERILLETKRMKMSDVHILASESAASAVPPGRPAAAAPPGLPAAAITDRLQDPWMGEERVGESPVTLHMGELAPTASASSAKAPMSKMPPPAPPAGSVLEQRVQAIEQKLRINDKFATTTEAKFKDVDDRIDRLWRIVKDAEDRIERLSRMVQETIDELKQNVQERIARIERTFHELVQEKIARIARTFHELREKVQEKIDSTALEILAVASSS